MDDLVERLRETTQAMASSCSVDMALWDRHSNACLEAATALRAAEARVADAEDDRDDYRERLRDLVMLDAERWATGGGPGYVERHKKAWGRARELFEP